MEENNFNNSAKSIPIQTRQAIEKADPVEEFLRKKFHIENVMKYEFESLNEKDVSDYDVSNVRGSVQLMEGHIMTVKESENLIHRAFNLDFSVPPARKP